MTATDTAPAAPPHSGELWISTTTSRPVLVVEDAYEAAELGGARIWFYDPYGKAVKHHDVSLQEFLGAYRPASPVSHTLYPAIAAVLTQAHTVPVAMSYATVLVNLTTLIARFFTDQTEPSQNLCVIAAYAAAYAVDYGPDYLDGRPERIERVLREDCVRIFGDPGERVSPCDETISDGTRAALLITGLMNVVGTIAVRKSDHNPAISETLAELAVAAMAWVAHNLSDDDPAGEGIGDITPSI